MDKNVRKILGGMSTAGLILAGSLPLMAAHGQGSNACATTTKAKSGTKAAKAKDKSAAKNAGDKAKTKAAVEKAKTQPAKAK